MAELSWQTQIDLVKPHVVRIMTPRGSGTGFLLHRIKNHRLFVIATAAHVVNIAHSWEEPIRFTHAGSGKSVLKRYAERAVIIDEQNDVAVITFPAEDIGLPAKPLPLFEKDFHVRQGVEIGWLGFPAVSRELCFFSGRVSAYLGGEYLIDGVAINGVSGGPAFMCKVARSYSKAERSLSIVGLLTAYIPNRSTGEVFPGVAVAKNVAQLHDIVAGFKSLEDAQAQQTPPSEAAGVPPAELPFDTPSSETPPNEALHPTPPASPARRGGRR